VEEKDRWGFCSATCTRKEVSPSVYHEEAGVQVLHQQNCVRMLDGEFTGSSAAFNPDTELCAGKLHNRKKREVTADPLPDGVHVLDTGDGEVLYIEVKGSEARILEKNQKGTGQRLTVLKHTDGVVGGVDACQGDSGGPLWVHWDHKATLIGTVSRGKECGSLNRPGVYTRVLPFLDWIYHRTKENGCFTM